ncbi:MAG: hypothetical protein Q4E51_05365 [Lachnospiraceae bacterium]|nr:hypothetical protein [Lachnospiraceae bacterium]
MAEAFEAIYNLGYAFWNNIVGIAMTLFSTSPTAAAGGVYATAHSLYTAITDISLPIAIVFFLIAIIKEVTATPPDQQIRRFFNDVIKFGVMVGILANLWTIMGYIIQIADGLTTNLVTGASYSMSLPSSLSTLLTDILTFNWPSGDIWAKVEYLLTFVMCAIIALLSSIATLVILVASSVSVLSSAFQRILKPLVMLPFSCVTVALAAGTGDAERVATSYLKTFFGFCISGAFMVICISLGAALGNSLLSIDMTSFTSSDAAKLFAISVQAAIIPIIIAGLVKSSDSIISKFF